MKRIALIMVVMLLAASCCLAAENAKDKDKDGWVSLFDGKSLKGWKVGENADSFSVQDGAIVANGPCAHLFYNGPVEDHNFKNFEFKADVMTTPGSNSGLYFHTKYQESSWPLQGFEAQVNTSHADPKRTASLYEVVDVLKVPVKDNEWFTQEIIVRGKRIVVKVNGQKLVDYTEPDDIKPVRRGFDRRLTSGTFAIQAHDPKSKVFFKNIMVKPLDD